MPYTAKGILDMAKGAFQERADYEMSRIVENILDANTDPKTKRKLTLTLELVPDSKRETVVVNVSAKSTLAPTSPVVTSLYIAGRDDDGAPTVIEMTPQIPGQLDVTGREQEEPPMLRLVSNQ